MDDRTSLRPIEVLLVEDNPGDVRLMRETFGLNKLITPNFSVVEDGVQAIAFLKRMDKFVNAPRPDLIILDLNLPLMDGREALIQIKKDPDLKRIPVVIMTTSESERDVLHAYNSNANCYVTKPVDLDQFINVVKTIKEFWFTIVKLPPDGDLAPGSA